MRVVTFGLRRIAAPIPPKPTSIIAHVAGSGTADVAIVAPTLPVLPRSLIRSDVKYTPLFDPSDAIDNGLAALTVNERSPA